MTENTEVKVGDLVGVPPTEGNISKLKSTGELVGIMGPYCKVKIQYGRQIGYWSGLLSEITPMKRGKK